jgi:hypothetical protein
VSLLCNNVVHKNFGRFSVKDTVVNAFTIKALYVPAVLSTVAISLAIHASQAGSFRNIPFGSTTAAVSGTNDENLGTFTGSDLHSHSPARTRSRRTTPVASSNSDILSTILVNDANAQLVPAQQLSNQQAPSDQLQTPSTPDPTPTITLHDIIPVVVTPPTTIPTSTPAPVTPTPTPPQGTPYILGVLSPGSLLNIPKF